jgi:hypothetical protein
MRQDEETVSQEVGDAIERAMGKLDGVFSPLFDGVRLNDDGPSVDDISVIDEPSTTELGLNPVEAAPPPPGRIVAVGLSDGWWRSRLRWLDPGEALVLVSIAAAWLAVGVAGVPVPVRVMATFWFLLACPGFAGLRVLQFRNPAILATLSLAASIGIDTVLAEIMLYTHTWSPGAAVAGLAGFSLAALAAGRRYRGRFGHALS